MVGRPRGAVQRGADRQARQPDRLRERGHDVLDTVGGTPAQTGDTLVTSINAKVQADAQQALNAAIERSRASGNSVNPGAGVVETTSGRIVAMASYLNYNPSVWTNGISPGASRQLPVRHRVRRPGDELGQPGPVRARIDVHDHLDRAAAMSPTGSRSTWTYNCPASYSIGGQSFANDGERPASDRSRCAPQLIQSCDTVYYEIAYQMRQTDDNKANFQLNPHGADPEDAAGGARLGVRQPTPGSICRRSRPAPSPPASGSTTTTRTTPTRVRTGARTARPTAPTPCSRSSKATTARAVWGPGQSSSPRSARAT